MLKQHSRKRKAFKIPSKRVVIELRLYEFPVVKGLEEISDILNKTPSENIFGALLHVVPLMPIVNSLTASKAERMLEYLGRAFEKHVPKQVENYLYVLEMLLREYDNTHHIRATKGMLPHEFLKALLTEDGLTQKSLVPDCFSSESQVSEFLHCKKGRDRLSYEQALALGKKFNVNPLNFISSP